MGRTRQKTRLLFLSSQTASETSLSTTNWYPGSRAKYSRCMVRRNLLTVNGGIVFAVFGRYGTRNFWDCHQELKERGSGMLTCAICSDIVWGWFPSWGRPRFSPAPLKDTQSLSSLSSGSSTTTPSEAAENSTLASYRLPSFSLTSFTCYWRG